MRGETQSLLKLPDQAVGTGASHERETKQGHPVEAVRVDKFTGYIHTRCPFRHCLKWLHGPPVQDGAHSFSNFQRASGGVGAGAKGLFELIDELRDGWAAQDRVWKRRPPVSSRLQPSRIDIKHPVTPRFRAARIAAVDLSRGNHNNIARFHRDCAFPDAQGAMPPVYASDGKGQMRVSAVAGVRIEGLSAFDPRDIRGPPEGSPSVAVLLMMPAGLVHAGWFRLPAVAAFDLQRFVETGVDLRKKAARRKQHTAGAGAAGDARIAKIKFVSCPRDGDVE